MSPPPMPVDQARDATSLSCSNAACARRRPLPLAGLRRGELVETSARFGSNLALLREALRSALEDSPQ
jgi:hypothetical protein